MATATTHIKGYLIGAFGGALRSRIGSGALHRLAGPRFQILVYHRVLAAPDPFAIAPVEAKAFAGQMALLRKCYRPVALAQLMDELDAGTVKPGTVCVTFDDGYRDNCEVALPILKAHGIPATIYLATDFIGTGKTPWYDRVFLAFKHTRKPSYSLPEAAIADAALGDAVARGAQANRVQDWLKRFPPAARDLKIDGLFRALGLDPEPKADLMLDWDQVRLMHREGIAFGAHTQSHPILSTVSAVEAEKEIAGSKARIEAEIGAPVRHFAYPNGKRGDYTAETKAILKKTGFDCSVTTNYGANPFDQDRFELFRSQPWEDNVNRFQGRLALERLA